MCLTMAVIIPVHEALNNLPDHEKAAPGEFSRGGTSILQVWKCRLIVAVRSPEPLNALPRPWGSDKCSEWI